MPSLNIAPSSQGPLRGITVVELGHSVAAPYAGQVLADLGARVIKVENPQAGDYARGWGPPYWGGAATIFTALNRGKESVTVDFSVAEEAARLRKLIVDEADAVIQNLRPNLLSKFGLGAEDLMSLKPSLIWCDIGAFGSVGPMKEKPGYDPLVQASAGIMSITGEADRPPVRVGVSIVDMGTALWAVIGLLAALVGRRGDGLGWQRRRPERVLAEAGLQRVAEGVHAGERGVEEACRPMPGRVGCRSHPPSETWVSRPKPSKDMPSTG